MKPGFVRKAASTDLVHWTQKPIALEPGVHPGDLWSGAGVVDVNNTSGLRTGAEHPFVVFSGTHGVIVHYSNDAGRTFQTYDGGRKVITPAGESRDPKVLWHAPTSRWVMVVWSNAGGNGVDLYTSTNLLSYPIEELASLRTQSASWSARTLTADPASAAWRRRSPSAPARTPPSTTRRTWTPPAS